MSIGAVAVVGGSRGIGAELARYYAARGIPTLALARTFPESLGSAQKQYCDVVSMVGLRGLSSWLDACRAPRLVIVTAAMLGPVGPIQSVDMKAFAQAVTVNVMGAANVLATVIPALNSGDRVVMFLGGGVGGPTPQPRVPAYITSKSALTGLIESVARDPLTKVPVIGLAPGAFPTALTRPALEVPRGIAGEALVEQVTHSQSLPMDISRVLAALEAISSPLGLSLSGRHLSANRDDLDAVARGCQQSDDLCRLRRVDGISVRVADSW